MVEPIWVDKHIVNAVCESIEKLSKNGEVPVEEVYLIEDISKQGISLSRRELVKVLITLETIGKISVEASGPRNEFRIKLVKRNT
ncbi:MAG: hypothetical protein GSR72_00650 [Desulfurococcales archaeon]|nr:hypothetical protein [Desulfurococcales archaeon]MEB3788386.1 hypothetical protein [Desulfurococcales archaeon]